MLGITIQLDISRLTPQTKTMICHHIKKILLKKNKNMGGLDQNSYANKNDT